jgi:hypothetical protein
MQKSAKSIFRNVGTYIPWHYITGDHNLNIHHLEHLRLRSTHNLLIALAQNFLQQEAKQNEQCGNVLQELRKELTELQKKMMIDSQKEELAQMQEFLQKSMLFM